jgi:hypothetical protein
MIVNKPVTLIASAAALTLALSQGVLAEPAVGESAAAPAGEAAAQAAPAVEPAPAAAESGATAPSDTPSAASSPPPAPEPAPPAEDAGSAAATSATAPAAAAPAPEAAAAPPALEAAAPAPTPEAAGAAPGATEAASAAPPPPEITAARERMEQRRAEMMEERSRRYQELRERAAEVGLDLPETPPWEQSGIQPPEMPSPPAMPVPLSRETLGKGRAGMTPEERDAMREQRYQAMRERAKQRGVELPETPPWKLMSDEERQAHWEKMRNMSPEERRAMREEHWKEMTQRAKEQGVELPETPPWKQAEQRREEMRAKWEAFRKIVDEMTPEQQEAAKAIFGRGQRQALPPAGAQMPPRMPMQSPYGQDYGAPAGFGQGPGMRGYGPQGAGPSAGPRPWFGAGDDMRQGPPPPAPGYNQGW